GPEPVGGRRERRAGRRELERAHDAAAVVGMDARRGCWVALGKEGVRALGPELVVDRLPVLALARRRRRRQLEIGARRAPVDTGAADDDRGPSCGDDLVEGG